MNDLKYNFSKYKNSEKVLCDFFKETVNINFEDHATLKKRYLRINRAPCMNEDLSKGILKRSCLRNKSLDARSKVDTKACNNNYNMVMENAFLEKA